MIADRKSLSALGLQTVNKGAHSMHGKHEEAKNVEIRRFHTSTMKQRERKMALANFEVVTLFVPDIGVTRAFYEKVFGVEVVYGDAVSAVFGFMGSMVNLLAETEAPSLVAPLRVGGDGVRAMLTIKVDDVDAECERLVGLGVSMLNGPIDRPWGRRTAAFADPAGHVWELAQDIGQGP